MSRNDQFIVISFALFVAFAATLTRVLPGQGTEVIVFALPWAQDGEALAVTARAGGAIVAGTALPWAIVARSNDKNFVSRLYRSGAVFVADPVLSRVCGAAVAADPLKGNSGEPA